MSECLVHLYILVTVDDFSFPLVMPATAQNMNYTSVITIGLMDGIDRVVVVIGFTEEERKRVPWHAL